MSTPIDLRRPVRVMATESPGTRNAHETVNVITALADKDKGKSQGGTPVIKEHVQITAAQYNAQPNHLKNQIDTFIDSGGTVAGLRTILIPGYAGPN